MQQLRKAEQRGVADFGWLHSRHSFSFGGYHDSRHMGFGPLRVINEDQVTPGAGFGKHGHQDMEIISYVISGALEHKDSIGTGSVIRPGDVQRMSAGRGIMHSEFNASKEDPVHFLQIWIIPETNGLKPSYEQKTLLDRTPTDALKLLGSRDGRDGSITIHRDVDLYGGVLAEGLNVSHPVHADRLVWVQIVHGEVSVNGQSLKAGDGLALRDQSELNFETALETELLVFDMAP
ncbi:MAG: pirin family protein [Pseudomonadota bacterium]